MIENKEEDLLDFFDSPQLPLMFHRSSSAQSLNMELSDGAEGMIKQERDENQKRSSKVEKNKKIRTSRNVQKTYHNILKNWLEQQKYSTILPKYNEYYNQRVYFILVLDQILKRTDGFQFYETYQNLASDVIFRKQRQIQMLQQQKLNSEQSLHLKRVIEQIKFSVRACAEFVQGNVLEALVIVYKRNQEKITKMKEFERAIQIFQQITGRNRNYF